MSERIERFEDLECWREARILARVIYRFTRGKGFESDRDLRWQLRAAAVSPMGNIAEAHGRYSFEDKRHFLDIALGSCRETQSHLYAALDQAYVTAAQFQEGYTQAELVGRLLIGSVANLDRQILARPSSRPRPRSNPGHILRSPADSAGSPPPDPSNPRTFEPESLGARQCLSP